MTILGLTVSASERGAQVGARCGGWSAAAGGALGGEGCLARNFLVAGGDVGVRGRRERRFSACYGWSMNGESLAAMSDVEVVARLVELLREERRLTAAVLAHLGEVEARRLYLPAACSSMHVYCTRALGMSEDQAFKRIRAARAARRYPVVAHAVEDGSLHLSGAVLLAPHLSEENVESLIAEARGKSKAEIEVMLARRAPRPGVAERLERVALQTTMEVAPGLTIPRDLEVQPEN